MLGLQATYVAQTGTQLVTWIDEHRKAITNCDTATSAIAGVQVITLTGMQHKFN